MYFNFVLFPKGVILSLFPFFLIWIDPKVDNNMYHKDLLKDWSTIHLKQCGWYLDCPKDSTPTSKVSFQMNFELVFAEQVMDKVEVSQGLKKALEKNLSKKKGKEKSTIFDNVVDLDKPQDEIQDHFDTLQEVPFT